MDFSQSDPYRPIGPGSASDEPVSGAPCQQCGQGPTSLQRYMWVMSFVLLTRHLEYEANLCRACATRTALREQGKSALFGWWGIPWGLKTLKALWINTRTLLRWSTLPAPAAVLTLVAGLALPAAAGYLVFVGSEEERQARETGDWVDQEVVNLMDAGNSHYQAGRLDEALASYGAAYEKAPRSTAVSSSMAAVLIDLGRFEEARAGVRRCLRAEETPGEAWALAGPWFPETLTAELDDYLETRPEPLPALLRLQLYNRITDAPAIRRLTARVGTDGDPLAQYVDMFAYGTTLGGESLQDQARRLEAHLESRPDHVLCRSMLAHLVARSDPARETT